MSQRDVRKYFFSLRVARKWNDLNRVVEAGSIYSFKNKHYRTHEARRESIR